ncbi:MAG TPA: hypothetical protein VFQ51_11705 [Vicinamibacteria bacterium]|nr:hypothetical protein [Vicinamibacteria bacterium]
MANGYKVRLGDGSEIGPMDLDTLRGWYVQGLITRESAVMLPGSTRWTTLGETNEMRSFKSGMGRPSAPPRPAPNPRPAQRSAAPQGRATSARGRAVESAPSRDIPWMAVAAVAGLAVLGGGAYYFLAPSAEEKAIRGFAQPGNRVADTGTGVTLEAPASWVVLRKEQNLVSAPADAIAVLAEPKRGAYAYVVAERASSAAEAYLEEVITARKAAVPSLAESGRTDRTLGKTPARQSLSSFESAGKRYQGVAVAAQESGTAFALVGWEPDQGGQPQEVLRLADALSVTAPKVAGLEEALATAGREVPFLTAAAAKAVMGQSAAQVLEPDETYRRAVMYMSMGIGSLAPKDQRELGDLNRTVYANVPQKERWRLAAYVDRVRNRASTAPADNKKYRELMRDAVTKLPFPKRTRLQQLYEQAVLKGLGMA